MHIPYVWRSSTAAEAEKKKKVLVVHIVQVSGGDSIVDARRVAHEKEQDVEQRTAEHTLARTCKSKQHSVILCAQPVATPE